MIDPHKILEAALADDRERLHELAAQAGTSLRRVLYVASATMLNTLAAEELHENKIRHLAGEVTPEGLEILRGVPHAWQRSADVTRWALRNKLMAPGGELTADGRLVLAHAEMNAKLAAQVRDRALSDEDLDHESSPCVHSPDRVENDEVVADEHERLCGPVDGSELP
jgi:hypothetical protein